MTTLDVLAIGAHPDDVELGCGATLARLVEDGRRVGIVHLTRGEAGTRGTVEQRRREAEGAAAALGVEVLTWLDCGDGGLRTGRAEEDDLIEVIRTWRPDVLIGPPPAERHPDHVRAHHLVADAAFYAGLRGRAPERGEPFRPGAVFCYMQNDQFQPTFIVDVSSVWQRKVDALDCYRTQLYVPATDHGPDAAGPATKVASREFREAVDGRARHYGLLIGVERGEPFWSPRPFAVGDLASLAISGLR
ncbi:MAG: bacillithiol biosynthesis deacetylase BshB1 [Acidobacteriota bacterium]